MIRVTVDSVRVSLLTQNRVVVLRESDSRRYLPIWIGQFEADAISFVLQSLTPSRPMTHDLLNTVFHQLNAQIEHVIINDIQDTTFYAQIVAIATSGQIIIDARSSDAIALAIRANVPIFVAPHVFDQSSIPFDTDDQQETPLFRSPGASPRSDAPTPAEEPATNDDTLSMFRDFINSLDNEDDNPKNKPE
ncbi:MAG: bifunctional nuclease family protein [Chloroflexia bacterium]|nr:bifunctional nuclease family protein [Chloroflexia bacterium]